MHDDAINVAAWFSRLRLARCAERVRGVPSETDPERCGLGRWISSISQSPVPAE
jgi:hypothetical protein